MILFYLFMILFYRVHQLPEELPKIDFAGYKARLPDPGMAERFQSAVS